VAASQVLQQEDDPMNRARLFVTFLCVITGFCLSGAFGRADDAKEKPKGASTLDDRTSMVTETVDGKEKTTKVDLKYSLKVKGYFDKDGFTIEELDNDAPVASLHDADGNEVGAAEKGDMIKELDGKAIKSAKDYVKAVNEAKDPSKIKIKLRDVNTGMDQEFYVAAKKQ
jgi:hypothetical protein